MIGGQTIIPIRGTNNQKLVLTSNPQSLKAGTYDKIKRAIEMQKEIVFNDVIVNTADGPLKISSFSEPVSVSYDTYGSVKFVGACYTGSGNTASVTVRLTNLNDIIGVIV